MIELYVMIIGPCALGTLAALLVTLGSRRVALRRRAQTFGGIAAVLALIPFLWPVIHLTFTRRLFQNLLFDDDRVRYSLPLLLGVVAVVVALIGVAPRRVSGKADLARKYPLMYAPRVFLIVMTLLLFCILLLTVTMGMASAPDEMGRYSRFTRDIGIATFSTGFYGWYQSVPAMILLVILLGVAWLSLHMIARVPLFDEDEAIVRARSTRVILLLVSGALVLHLASIVGAIMAAAVMRGGVTTDQGWISVYSPYGEAQWVFVGIDMALQALGVYCWARVFWLSMLRARKGTQNVASHSTRSEPIRAGASR